MYPVIHAGVSYMLWLHQMDALSLFLYIFFFFFFYPFTYVPHYEYIKIINKVCSKWNSIVNV